MRAAPVFFPSSNYPPSHESKAEARLQQASELNTNQPAVRMENGQDWIARERQEREQRERNIEELRAEWEAARRDREERERELDRLGADLGPGRPNFQPAQGGSRPASRPVSTYSSRAGSVFSAHYQPSFPPEMVREGHDLSESLAREIAARRKAEEEARLILERRLAAANQEVEAQRARLESVRHEKARLADRRNGDEMYSLERDLEMLELEQQRSLKLARGLRDGDRDKDAYSNEEEERRRAWQDRERDNARRIRALEEREREISRVLANSGRESTSRVERSDNRSERYDRSPRIRASSVASAASRYPNEFDPGMSVGPGSKQHLRAQVASLEHQKRELEDRLAASSTTGGKSQPIIVQLAPRYVAQGSGMNSGMENDLFQVYPPPAGSASSRSLGGPTIITIPNSPPVPQHSPVPITAAAVEVGAAAASPRVAFLPSHLMHPSHVEQYQNRSPLSGSEGPAMKAVVVSNSSAHIPKPASAYSFKPTGKDQGRFDGRVGSTNAYPTGKSSRSRLGGGGGVSNNSQRAQSATRYPSTSDTSGRPSDHDDYFAHHFGQSSNPMSGGGGARRNYDRPNDPSHFRFE